MVNQNVSILVFLILFLSCHFGMCQKRKIVGCDAQTHEGIPYATIKIKNNSIGLFADEKGHFQITIKDNDSLDISCIGYHPKTANVESDTVFLDPMVYTLDEIKIGKDKRKSREIGLYHSKNIICKNYMDIDCEAVLKINIPDKYFTYRIKAVRLKYENGIKNNPVRLHIYNMNADELPGSDLLPVIVQVNDEIKGNDVIDLSTHKLVLNDRTLFVGVEWLSMDEGKKPIVKKQGDQYKSNAWIGTTHACPQSLTYERSKRITNDQWVLDSKLFQTHGKNPENLMVSLIIE